MIVVLPADCKSAGTCESAGTGYKERRPDPNIGRSPFFDFGEVPFFFRKLFVFLVSLVEFVHASGGVHEFHLSGIERV